LLQKPQAETTLALVEAAKNIKNAVWGKNKFLGIEKQWTNKTLNTNPIGATTI